MPIKIDIDNEEKIISANDTKDKINKSHTLYISYDKIGDIGAVYIDYILIKYNTSPMSKYFICDYHSLFSDIVLTTSENFEVRYTTNYGDYTDKNVLISSTINIYKQPHAGWNFRIYDNIIFNIMNDGEAKLWTYQGF